MKSAPIIVSILLLLPACSSALKDNRLSEGEYALALYAKMKFPEITEKINELADINPENESIPVFKNTLREQKEEANEILAIDGNEFNDAEAEKEPVEEAEKEPMEEALKKQIQEQALKKQMEEAERQRKEKEAERNRNDKRAERQREEEEKRQKEIQERLKGNEENLKKLKDFINSNSKQKEKKEKREKQREKGKFNKNRQAEDPRSR